MLPTLTLAARLAASEQARAELASREALLRAVSHMARIGGWEFEAASQALRFADELYAIHELPPHATLSMTALLAHYPDRARALLLAAFEAALHEGRPYDLELPFMTASGRWIWMRAQAKAECDATEQVVRVCGTFQDITERKRTELALSESEERYRRLFEASIDAIVLTDDDGIYLDVNDAAATLFGIPRERLIGCSANELPEQVDSEGFIDQQQDLVTGHATGTFTFRCPDGSLRIAQYTVVRLGVNLYQRILRDVTAEHAAAMRLRSSLAEKDMLLKELHHRVKNNLQVIASMLRLQSDQLSDPEVRELFLESQRRVRAMALVHERLYQAPDLARLDLAVYVRTLANDLLRAYRLTAAQVTVRVDIRVAEVNIDQAMALGLILNELIANSLKHAFAPGQQGTITVQATHPPGGSLTLSVADDGIGFPPDLDPASSPSMGLKIVHALATQLGGTLIWHHDHGTTALLKVP
ncbi:MAG: sensor histidine kinase [Oscillochloridaceae bacterium umkhey_bin13]